MPRDGANVYTLPEAPFVNDSVAQAPAMNSTLSDIATALTDSFTRAETTAYTRTLLDDANAAAAQTTLALYLGVTAGTSTAITATPAAALPAYATGLLIGLRITTSCGDQPTLNVSGLGAKKIYATNSGGVQQASTGDLFAGDMAAFRYDAALDGGAGGWIITSATAAGWRTIETRPVSAQAQSDFALPSAFRRFRLTFRQITADSTGRWLAVRFGSGGVGGSYSTSSYVYGGDITNISLGTASPGVYGATSAGTIYVSANTLSNTGNASASGIVEIDVGTSSLAAVVTGHGTSGNSTDWFQSRFGGAWGGGAAANALRVYTATGVSAGTAAGSFSGGLVLEGLR